MSVFAVCSCFVENSGSEKEYLLNVLYRFILDNPLRISVDSPEARIIECYEEAANRARSQDLKRWLRHWGRNQGKNIEFVRVDCKDLSERETFVKVAQATVVQQSLIVWSLQDYVGVDSEGTELIDRYAAAGRVREHDYTYDRSMQRAPEVKSAQELVMIENFFAGISGFDYRCGLFGSKLVQSGERNAFG